MLASLSIRDIVLIERLDLTFRDGLCVLTGETGAGKSILLDSLGLALGARADQGLLRPGADRASVTAAFELPTDHPALALLAEHELSGEDDMLVLRRVLGADGRSRAFVNDQPVSVGLLRQLGDGLVEIQGQFEQHGLLDGATHRGLLDAFGRLDDKSRRLNGLWRDWRTAVERLETARQEVAQARIDEDYLRHAVAELDRLAPQPGEEAALAEQRSLLMHREKLIESLNAAAAELTGENGPGGAETALGAARRSLERAADKAGGRLDAALAALDRAAAETEEALAQIAGLSADMELEGDGLEQVEDRYFALKDLARKHGVEADRLAALRDALAERLAAIDGGAERLQDLERAAGTAREAFAAAAEALSRARAKAAKQLAAAVNAELPPLKLEKTRFHVLCERLEEPRWGPQGLDRVSFAVATNPGAPPGPLGRIASGGELSRLLLALKVVLAAVEPSQSLVFDEVDSAVGGATAHAVGERLERLAQDRQVLVVTHSPQVAARGTHHWRVRKETAAKNRVATQVGELSPGERREALARMLSGATVTDEARAAADRLIGAA